jgi:hypothetical protein
LVATGVFGLSLAFFFSEWSGFLSQSQILPQAKSNLSVHRVLSALALDVPAFALLMVACAATALLSLREKTSENILYIATTATVLSLARVWTHTLIFSLPVICAALTFSWRNYASTRSKPRNQRSRARLALAGALLGSIALLFAEPYGALDLLLPSLGSRLAAMGALIPLTVLLLLTRYVINYGRPRRVD